MPFQPAFARLMHKHLHLLAELLANLALPWLAYTLAEPHYGEFGALVASSVPPLLWSLAELIRHRRVDALSMMVLAGIALSMLAMLLGGDARLLLLRESLISGLIGLVFLVSLLLKKPLIFYLARATMARQDAEMGAQHFSDWWENAHAQRTIRVITAVWGLGLTAEAVLRSYLAWHWTPQRFLAIAPIIGYAAMGALGAWTFWYTRRHRSHEA